MYRLSNLDKWVERRFDTASESDWLDLLDDFGPALIRFIIQPGQEVLIPEGDAYLAHLKHDIEKNHLTSLACERNSVWILFAFKGRYESLPLPFRQDGMMIPFEWRVSDQPSDLVPCELEELSEKVKRQLCAEDTNYRLYPASFFMDDVDLRMPGTTYESAWGALVSGLFLADHSDVKSVAWPFSSVAYDFEGKRLISVGSLARKLLVCKSFGAEELAVVDSQARECATILDGLKKTHSDLRHFKVFSIEQKQNVRDIV